MIQNANDFFELLKAENIFHRFGLQRIGLFGSLARGEAFQDIDILIEEPLHFQQLLSLQKLLETKTGCRVDIVQKEYAEPVIFHRALKEVRYAAAS
jgi:predicted nucleotidyltransferase